MTAIKTRNTFEPDWTTPPGATLLEILESQMMTQRELAKRANLSAKHINQIILGASPITPETAILLERIVGVSAKFWNTREADYQTRKAKIKAREQLLEDCAILKHPVVKDLIKRSEIEKKDDPAEQLEALLSFFKVGSVKQLHEYWKMPYETALRHSPSFQSDPTALAAWLRIGERQAESIECHKYDEQRFKESLYIIRKWTVDKPDTFTDEMVRLCAESGVALVFVKEMKNALLEGATKWLSPDKAMIALNLRSKTNDTFWFTFFHEAAHILHDGKRQFIIDGTNRADNDSEKRADDFARKHLVPEEQNQYLPC